MPDPTPKSFFLDRTEATPEADEGQEAQLTLEKGGAFLKLIEVPPLKDEIEALGTKWKLKPEFHVTMVGFASKLDKKYKEAEAAAGRKVSNADAAVAVEAALKKAGDGMQFRVRFTPETRRVVKEAGVTETVIKMCDVEGIEEYLGRVETELGLPVGSIERPPTHTTVYTLENGQGIGIPNATRLEEMSKILSPEELTELREASQI